MTWEEVEGNRGSLLPPRSPEPPRERRGCRFARRDLEGFWRPEPDPFDNAWGIWAWAVILKRDGEPPRLPPEPPPPAGWSDWPRTPAAAARRLAAEWYDIEPQGVTEDPADGAIIVTGWQQ